jgi:hypothetical protein
MVCICAPSSKRMCLESPFQKVVVNHHFASFNNLEKHLEEEAFGSYSLSFFAPFVMLFIPFVNSDADLLWSEDGSDVYFKLFYFSNFLQVYAETNHVDDVANARPSYLQMLQMLKLLMLLTIKLVMLLIFCFHNFITL